MAEELLLLKRKELTARHATELELQQALDERRAQFQRIYSNPTSQLTWFGDTNTYKWWASILQRDLFESLRSVSTPVYIVHGTEDTNIPVESADLLTERLSAAHQTNITYVRREGLNHFWNNPQGQDFNAQVWASAFIWLMVREDQDLRNRIMDVVRQDPHQMFGTQGRNSHGGLGCWEPYSIEDPAHIDERRAEYGLSTLADYKRQMNEYTCHTVCEEGLW